MNTKVVTVEPSMPVSSLREILRDNRISGTPVVENGKLVGMISIEDFIRWLADGATECRVEERMTRDIVTANEDEPLVMAVNRLERFGFGRLPVVERKTGELRGVLTKGDSIAGLLRKLDVDYREAEVRSARSRHIFEDIAADRCFLVVEYQIMGGDPSQAGASASGLKRSLLQLGISPQTVRRAAIAAYEAEMNVIFYADGGRITATITPASIRLEVVDEGPGIADVEKAMQPGFSTAPDWVRELGFGAGMGLVNIRECADDMSLESTVGNGTRLVVDILLEAKHDAQ